MQHKVPQKRNFYERISNLRKLTGQLLSGTGGSSSPPNHKDKKQISKNVTHVDMSCRPRMCSDEVLIETSLDRDDLAHPVIEQDIQEPIDTNESVHEECKNTLRQQEYPTLLGTTSTKSKVSAVPPKRQVSLTQALELGGKACDIEVISPREVQPIVEDLDDFYKDLETALAAEVQEDEKGHSLDNFYKDLEKQLAVEIDEVEQEEVKNDQKEENLDDFYGNLALDLHLEVEADLKEEDQKQKDLDSRKKTRFDEGLEVAEESAFPSANVQSPREHDYLPTSEDESSENEDSKDLHSITEEENEASEQDESSKSSSQENTFNAPLPTDVSVNKSKGSVNYSFLPLLQTKKSMERPDPSSNPIVNIMDEFAFNLGVHKEEHQEIKDKILNDIFVKPANLPSEPGSASVKTQHEHPRENKIHKLASEYAEDRQGGLLNGLGSLPNLSKFQSVRDVNHVSLTPREQKEKGCDQEHLAQDILQQVQSDITKHKVQIEIMSYFLKTHVSQNEESRVKILNKQIKKLNEHEIKVRRILDRFKKEDKKLHFAFFFACPLVLSYNSEESTQPIYKLIPSLNYEKEFDTIVERLHASQSQLAITKRQCTVEALKEVLAKQPLALHFSGHGILNRPETVGEIHYLHKDEGDFLLLETSEGDSQLVSRCMLQQLIMTSNCQLEFVVVATCHSEFVGKIFLEAGARHVICIKQSKEVSDQAVLTFTETFYDTVFQQNMDICSAFKNAQIVVSISHSAEEAQTFKILVQDQPLFANTEKRVGGRRKTIVKKPHICDPFGPFPKGHYKMLDNHDVVFKQIPPKLNSLVGRQKDSFKIIQKVLSQQTSRLITLMGLPGVGKSALIRTTLHHIQERCLLKGGSIFVNVRNVRNTDQFIKLLVKQLIYENPVMFGNVKQNEDKQYNLETLNLILTKIAFVDGTTLLVIDNCEDLITLDKNNFRKIITLILWRVAKIKVLLTSRMRLSGLPDFNEQLLLLNELNKQSSALLFKQMTREIPQKEVQALLKEKPNTKKFPDQIGVDPPHKLHEHHLFGLLGGNPQAIQLVAPLLADPEKNFTLVQLYQILSSRQLSKILRAEEIQDSMMASLRLSLQVSIQQIYDTDPDSMKLFFLLGLLPGGISPQDLDILWKKINKDTSGNRLETSVLDNSLAGNDNKGGFQNVSNESQWRRSFYQLDKAGLISETKIHGSHKCSQTNIKLPEFVSSFSEAMIDEKEREHYHEQIGDWFYRHIHSLYVVTGNVKFPEAYQQQYTEDNQIVNFEQNMFAFIQRISDKFVAFEPAKTKTFSESDFTMSEMSDQEDERNKGDLPLITIDSHEIASDKSLDLEGALTKKSVRKSSKTLADVIVTQLDQQAGTPPKLGSPEISWNQMKESLDTSLFGQKTVVELEVLRNIVPYFVKYASPRDCPYPKHRAYLWWRLAMTKIKEHARKRNMSKVQLFANSDLDISFDSDEEETNKKICNKVHAHLSEEELSVDNSRENVLFKRVKMAFKKKFESQIDRIQGLANVSFKRGSMFGQKEVEKRAQQRSQMKSFMKRQQSHSRYSGTMSNEEIVVVYSVVLGILSGQLSLVSTMIQRQLVRLNMCSEVFQGNIRRFESLTQMLLFEQSTSKQQNTFIQILSQELTDSGTDLIEDSLQKALNHFKSEKCFWGMALTYFQYGVLKSSMLYTYRQNALKSNDHVNINANLLGLQRDAKFRAGLEPEDCFKKAMKFFTHINHLRGIALCNKHLKIIAQQREENESCINEDSDGKPGRNSEHHKHHWGGIAANHHHKSECKNHIDEYEEQYHLHLSMFNMATEQDRDICISRSQGEDFSLLVEVVHSSDVTQLFDKKDKITNMLGFRLHQYEIESDSSSCGGEDENAGTGKSKAMQSLVQVLKAAQVTKERKVVPRDSIRITRPKSSFKQS